jgi:hypothetical protein
VIDMLRANDIAGWPSHLFWCQIPRMKGKARMLSSLDKVVMHERVGVHDVELDNVLYDVHRLGAHIIGDKLSKSPIEGT